MVKALWAVAIGATVALGICIFGTVVTHSDVRVQSRKVSAVARQESVDRQDIAKLRAEVRALSAGRSATP